MSACTSRHPCRGPDPCARCLKRRVDDARRARERRFERRVVTELESLPDEDLELDTETGLPDPPALEEIWAQASEIRRSRA